MLGSIVHDRLAGRRDAVRIANNCAFVLLFAACLHSRCLFAQEFPQLTAETLAPVSPAEGVAAQPLPLEQELEALMLAASASFVTPIGYQTNMMIYGPGGYRFTDFLKVGIPLNLLLWLVAILIIPMVWSF